MRAIASARPPGGAFLSPVPCSSCNFPRDVVGQQPRYAATRMELLQVKFEAGKSSRWRFLRIASSAGSWGTLFYLKQLPSYQVFFAFGGVCRGNKENEKVALLRIKTEKRGRNKRRSQAKAKSSAIAANKVYSHGCCVQFRVSERSNDRTVGVREMSLRFLPHAVS